MRDIENFDMTPLPSTQDITEIVHEACSSPVTIVDDPEKSFFEYGLDSLDTSNILLAIEDKYDISIPDDKLDSLSSVANIVNYLRRGVSPPL